jgi:uncharacterized protein (TIGR02597 family)
MNKKFFYFWMGLVAALGLSPVLGQTASTTAASVAKVPTGVQTITLKQGVSTWFSLPLSEQPVYTGVVNGVTSTTISVASSASLPANLSGSATPYFVQFLTGAEIGRTLLITAGTSTSLTLDITDHGIGAPVALNASGFSVAAGDQFVIFPGDTLASVFGANTPGNPLLLKGSSNEGRADQVSLWGASQQVYFFNTSAGYWELSNSTANANNTIIYPYSVMSVLRVANSNATLLVAGQVTQAKACYKVVQNTNTYASSHYATPITLAQLKMGSNWLTGPSGGAADDLGIWSAATGTFTFYYEKPNGNWYLCLGNSTAIQNNVTIPAGTATSIYKRSAVSGGQAFLVSAMPYSVGIN